VTDMIPSLQTAVATWKTLNPDYEMVYYNNETARQFIVDNYDADVLEAYDTLVPGAYKADLFRYCELYKNGGFYVDIKMNCKMSLDVLMSKKPVAEMLLTLDSPTLGRSSLFNGFFGIVPNSPLLLLAIQRCVLNVKRRYYGVNSLDPTGPILLGRCFREWKGQNPSSADCSGFYGRGGDIVWCKYQGGFPDYYFVSETGCLVVDTHTPGYRASNSSNYYANLWINRSIYTDSPPYVPPKRATHMFLPRNLRR
jgi:hypothetical protein